ncbi:DUF418 domain-containing protein [Sanguibacter keddieii]|uniref:DUF418 domain-containing protein n=1 Tax=Sanguibacter keddieii TaxID=60920 RepID=UPI0002D4C73E|nr:DUF418 domain-containing protein [Sanguibacter keddieii]
MPAIDVLRGIAILGTLASNIWIFTVGLESWESEPLWLTELVSSLPNGKFLGLLTIMFGIGLEIQRQAALRAGRSWPGTYPVRAGLLFLDGVVNYVFVIQFDVLRAYAFTGLIVAFLLLTSERVQLWIAALFVALHVGLLVINVEGTGVDRSMTGDESMAPADVGSGGYWSTVRNVLDNFWVGFSPGSEFTTIVVMGVAMFLLGARLYRAGVFEPAGRVLRRWLMVVGLLVALPVDLVLRAQVLDLPLVAVQASARYGTAAVVAFGILALVAEVYQHRPVGWSGRRLADVGAMALSCYMLQNILGVIFSHTVAPAVELSPVGALVATGALFLGISGFLVVFSGLWLRRFGRGPFELFWSWCYRTITRT